MSVAKSKEIRLSSNGLAQLSENYYENDFTFVVGGREYHSPCWFADFISPRISRLRSNDAMIRDFCIEGKESNAAFESLLLFRRGIAIEVNESNSALFLGIALLLFLQAVSFGLIVLRN
jgi:hypothetical protein